MKKRIVDRILGQAVQPYGYEAFKPGPHSYGYKSTITSEEGEEIDRVILIHQAIYGPRSVQFQWYTTAYRDKEKVFQFSSDWWDAETDEQLIAALNDFVAYLIEGGGLQHIEDQSIPSVPMGRRYNYTIPLRLYEDHVQLSNQFMEEHGLSVDTKRDDKIRVLYNEIETLSGFPFERNEPIDPYLQAAAFYGKLIEEYRYGKWVYKDKKCMVAEHTKSGKWRRWHRPFEAVWLWASSGISFYDFRGNFVRQRRQLLTDIDPAVNEGETSQQ